MKNLGLKRWAFYVTGNQLEETLGILKLLQVIHNLL